MNVSNAIQRFLSSVHQRREADFYLSLFQSKEPEKFAAIFIDAETAKEAISSIAADVAVLSDMGLSPVLLFETNADLDTLLSAFPKRVQARLVSKEEIRDMAREGIIPLVKASAQENIETVRDLGTQKVILLSLVSGLGRNDELPIVDLARDFVTLSQPGALAPERAAVLKRAETILSTCPAVKNVGITSALNLLRELFTIRGAGTLVRRGARIEQASSLKELDRAALADLFQRAFQKTATPAFFERDIVTCFHTVDYSGAAIVEPAPCGFYLSKFAVSPEGRGEGMGRDLFAAVGENYRPLFWRCRAENPIHAWYLGQASGHHTQGAWTVFWLDMPRAALPDAIEFATSRPDDFAP